MTDQYINYKLEKVVDEFMGQEYWIWERVNITKGTIETSQDFNTKTAAMQAKVDGKLRWSTPE